MWVRFIVAFIWPKGLPWHVDHQPSDKLVRVKRDCGEAAVAAGVAEEQPAPARQEDSPAQVIDDGLADPAGG